MSTKRLILFCLAIGLLIFGFATTFYPWDYMACAIGGFLFSSALITKDE